MKKIYDKLAKVNDSFTVNIYDNGYMLEIGGRDSEDEYKTAKLLCNSAEELLDLVSQAINMPLEG